MARPHHRKKHKEHVRQYRHQQDELDTVKKGKSYLVFTVLGVLTGAAIAYFASESNWLWIAAGALAGGFAGYYIGMAMDRED